MVDLAQPFNALIAQNNAPPQNPLTTTSQFLGVQNQALQNQALQATADDAQLANAQNHVGYIINAMTPLLRKGADISPSDVAQAGADAVAETKGRISPSEIAHFVGQLPSDGPGIQAALQQHLMRLQDANSRIATLRGQPIATNIGGQTVFGTRDAFNNTYSPQAGSNGSITNTMTPEGAASLQQGPVDPNTGARTMIPAGVAAERGGLAAPGTYTGNSGAIPVSISPSGQITKRRVSAGAPVMTPPATGPIQTDPSPGQAIALKAGGDQYASAGQNASTYAQQMQQLQSALTGLQNTTTGPGTESRQAIASYMLALPGGIGQYLPGVDPRSIQAYDEANKYLTQTAQGSPNATRSDAGLTTALGSSPSVHISNAAAQDVLKANIGFRRAEMGNYAAFQRSGLDPGQFQSFMAQRNQQIDPRAYTVDLLSPAQRSTFISSLSPAAKAKFFNSVRDAMASGQIDTSALTGGAGGGR